eukprot:Rmarinus@m.27551
MALPPQATFAPHFLPSSMYSMMRLNCVLSTWGPCSTFVNGSPTTRFLANSTTRFTTSSYTLSSTNTREPAQQTCPWFQKIPLYAWPTASSKLASAKMMFGDLPPSSNVTFLRLDAPAAC